MRKISYINGNYYVTLGEDGTKTYRALRRGEDFMSSFPDSIDLKITNKCSIGCSFCHESSTNSGKSFNLERTKQVLSSLPRVGIELAIGGGDVLEESVIKDCYDLCLWATEIGKFVPRLTLNSKSIDTEKKLKRVSRYFNNIDSIGVSIDKFDKPLLDLIQDSDLMYRKIIVYHIISGIFPPEDLLRLLNYCSSNESRVLILGYKDWGRAKGIPPKYSLQEWEKELKKILYKQSSLGVVGFDNLAIEQLSIRDCLTEESWKRFYMGNEFSHTMYIDAVSEIFAPTSRDSFKVSWGDMNVLEFFNKYKRE